MQLFLSAVVLWTLLGYVRCESLTNRAFYQGCHNYTPRLEGGRLVIPFNGEACLKLCSGRGQKIAGLDSINKICYCGEGIMNHIVKTNSDLCKPCEDNSNLFCGENLKLSVYEIGPDIITTTVKTTSTTPDTAITTTTTMESIAYNNSIKATVLSGTFCKEKTAQLPSLDYQDATVPEDFKNVSQGDNRETLLVPSSGTTASTNTSSVLRAARVDKVLEVSTTTAPIEVESPYINEELNNSTKKRKHTIIDPVSIKLLRGETNGITVTDMALSDPILFFNYTQAKAYSVDYHYAKKIIFFTSLGAILRNDVVGRLTRTGAPKVVVSGVEGPTRLAVDWVHDKVYWMSDTHQTVEVAGLDGANRTLLFDNLQRFRFHNNIAIDPYAGYLFLVSNYSMFRANLDGTNLTWLQMEGEVTRGVKCLALDTCKRRVYYSGKEGGLETGTPYIASCDYDGGSVQDHPLVYKWNDIYSLDVFRDTIYFAHYSEMGPDTLYSADLTKTKLTPIWLQTADPASGGIWSVRVYHPGVQQNPRGNNCLEKSENFNRGA